MLESAGLSFKVICPPTEEPALPRQHARPAELAAALAYFKACSVAQASLDRKASLYVLGADTVVHREGILYGKPIDRVDASRILSQLAGTTHSVTSGVALLAVSVASGVSIIDQRLVSSETTIITMRPMDIGEIEAYIQSGAADGKAGAYAIQEGGDAFVEKLAGSFSNVVGLPMALVCRMLIQMESRSNHK